MRSPFIVSAIALCVACEASADLGGITPVGPPLSTDASPAEATSGEPEAGEAGRDAPVVDAARDEAPVVDAPVDSWPETGRADSGYPKSCDDNIKDGDETDVDCGGSCPPCGLAQGCLVNSDCGKWPGCDPANGCACDVVSLTCVYDHCSDHKQDDGETAVDCGGGTCAGCPDGDPCQLDSDCVSDACDATALTCAVSTCADHVQDGDETGIDCGGGVCPGCPIGEGCELDGDCASKACDGISSVCIADQCADHRQDGSETDVDCGGSTCTERCTVGQKCIVTSDCVPSAPCAPGNPHVCE